MAVLVVCGNADCIWRDLEEFGCRAGNGVAKWGWDFCTVNRLVETFAGRIDHAYSHVGAVLERFIAARRDEYRDEFGPPLCTHSRTDGTDYAWPLGTLTELLDSVLSLPDLPWDTMRSYSPECPLTDTPP